MLTVKENTTLVGVSELRKGIEKILEKALKGLVIIEKRHKPTDVLMSNEEYEHIQQIVEHSEDIVLGFIAHNRLQNSKEKDYLYIKSCLK